MSNIFSIGFIGILLSGSFSCSNEISDSFHAINVSLIESLGSEKEILECYHDSITKFRNINIDIANQADSIYLKAKALNEMLENIKTQLYSNDTNGSDINISAKLLIETKTGMDLFIAMNNFYECARKTAVNKNELLWIENIGADFKNIFDFKKWQKKSFEAWPTIAVIALLKKHQQNCLSTGVMVLKELNVEIRK